MQLNSNQLLQLLVDFHTVTATEVEPVVARFAASRADGFIIVTVSLISAATSYYLNAA